MDVISHMIDKKIKTAAGLNGGGGDGFGFNRPILVSKVINGLLNV